MKKLYVDSVCAAYSGDEFGELLRRSALADARTIFHERTHLGFVRDGQGPGRRIEHRTITAAGGF